MKNDKEIREVVTKIQTACNDYNKFVEIYNECAYTDRMLEAILEGAKTLDVLYEENSLFEYSVYGRNLKYVASKQGVDLSDLDIANICTQNATNLPCWSLYEYEKAVKSFVSNNEACH